MARAVSAVLGGRLAHFRLEGMALGLFPMARCCRRPITDLEPAVSARRPLAGLIGGRRGAGIGPAIPCRGSESPAQGGGQPVRQSGANARTDRIVSSLMLTTYVSDGQPRDASRRRGSEGAHQKIINDKEV